MPDKLLKILIIEDSVSDAALLQEEILQCNPGAYRINAANSLKQAEKYFKEDIVEAVLLDLNLPDSAGLETVQKVMTSQPDVPIVVLTGFDDEKTGIEAVRMGAQDYLVKGKTDGRLLSHAVRYAIERKKLEVELRRTRDELEIRVEERTRTIKKQSIFLEKYQEQLRALMAELVKVEENERRKLAMELHDSIGQILAFLKIELGSLQSELKDTEFYDSIHNLRQEVEKAIHQTRTLTFEMSPPELYTLGLNSAIEELAQRFSKERGLRCNIEIPDNSYPLNDQIKIILFRSVREILVNTAKHAHAACMQIKVYRKNNNIVISLEDDGIGFDTSRLDKTQEKKFDGFGLFNISERLKQLGGKLEITSVKGEGTKTILYAPLEKKK
jgi:signal transduction histidine kinase